MVEQCSPVKNHLAPIHPQCVIGNELLEIRNRDKKPVVAIVATFAEFLLVVMELSAVAHLPGNILGIVVQKVFQRLQPSFSERLESSIDISRADFRALSMGWSLVREFREKKDGYW